MMVVSIAPAVRVAISEAFDLPPGTVKVGQIVAGLRKLGFNQVFGESSLTGVSMIGLEHRLAPDLSCGSHFVSELFFIEPLFEFFLSCIDTLFAADLTIMEEGTELLHRLAEHLEGNPNKEEPMPMFTSCCPGWVGENSRLKHTTNLSVDPMRAA